MHKEYVEPRRRRRAPKSGEEALGTCGDASNLSRKAREAHRNHMAQETEA
jgi:hypothetical protein